MTSKTVKPLRCAIYTRVSTEAGLEQDFNSLDAQYDAAQAYIRSQAHAGWTLIRTRYDDGGYSGGSTERPALQRLLADVKARKVQIIVVYKVDRLTRSLADFAKLVERRALGSCPAGCMAEVGLWWWRRTTPHQRNGGSRWLQDSPIPNSSFCPQLRGAMIAEVTCRQTLRAKRFARPSISYPCWAAGRGPCRWLAPGLATRC